MVRLFQVLISIVAVGLVEGGQQLWMAAASPSRSTGDTSDLWLWVEHASWVAALLGVVLVLVGVIQLKQLMWRPRLAVGFVYNPDPAGTSSGSFKLRVRHSEKLAITWSPGHPISDPFDVTVSVVNEGTATADAVNLEVRLPDWVILPPGAPFKKVPSVKAWSFVQSDKTLNPGDTYYVRQTVTIPIGHKDVSIHAIVSYRDAPTIDRLLKLSAE